MTISSQYIEVQGLRTHLLCAGSSGPVVFLLHGGGADSARLSWEPTLQALSARYRVVAPDWPGYGDSDRPDAEYTQEFYIHFLDDLVDRLGIGQAAFAGISMGGGIALGYTLECQQRVTGLALVDSYGLACQAPFHMLSYLFIKIPLVNEITWAWMKRSRSLSRLALQGIFHNPRAMTEDLVDLVWEEAQKPHAGRAFQSFQKNEVGWSGLRTCYASRLGEIRVPTLILHGAADRLVPLDTARQAHARIPGSRLEILAEAGHWPQREKPAEVNRILADFLAQLPHGERVPMGGRPCADLSSV